MARTLGSLCAGVLLMAAVGCAFDSLFVSVTGSSGRSEKTVPIALEQCSLTVHSFCQSTFGIHLVDSREGEELRLSGKTGTGKSFQFILKRQTGNNGDTTVIAFEGDKDVQELLWERMITAILIGIRPQAQQPATTQAPATTTPAATTATPDANHVQYDRIHGGVQ